MNLKQSITACVFIHKDNKALIARRADTKSFLPGVWELMGGHIEFGETIEDGLMRELKEELDVEIVIDRPYHVFTYLTDNNTEHVVEIEYLAILKNPDQKIVIKPEDHSDFKWITESEIEIYFEGNDQEATAVKKGFEAIKKSI
jgi:8-oxo-dGTP diphosphatase